MVSNLLYADSLHSSYKKKAGSANGDSLGQSAFSRAFSRAFSFAVQMYDLFFFCQIFVSIFFAWITSNLFSPKQLK